MASFKQHPHYAPVTICHVDGGMAWCIQKDDVVYMANVWVQNHFTPSPIHTDYEPEAKGFWEKMMAEGIIETMIHEEIDFDWIKG